MKTKRNETVNLFYNKTTLNENKNTRFVVMVVVGLVDESILSFNVGEQGKCADLFTYIYIYIVMVRHSYK
jgi:hypothetical protein